MLITDQSTPLYKVNCPTYSICIKPLSSSIYKLRNRFTIKISPTGL